MFRMYINCENVTDTEMCIDESTSDTDNSMDWIFGREDEEDDTEQQEETTVKTTSVNIACHTYIVELTHMELVYLSYVPTRQFALTLPGSNLIRNYVYTN